MILYTGSDVSVVVGVHHTLVADVVHMFGNFLLGVFALSMRREMCGGRGSGAEKRRM